MEIVRSYADADRLADTWDAASWQREEAEREYLVARARAREAVPYAIFVGGSALAGRLEERRLRAGVGYKTVYAPTVRLLHVVDGGIHAPDPVPLAETLRAALGRGEFEAVAFPFLREGSPELRAFESLGGAVRTQLRTRAQPRRRLELPGSFEDFVASRSSNTRWRIRRDERRLEEAFGDELHAEILRDPGDLDRLFTDAERVAERTYQRALGTGFADTAEQRATAEVAMRRGWLRGYILDLRDEPIAFWLCSTYRDTMTIRTTGYVQEHAELRVGLYLLMRVIEDAIADPALAFLDFGPGDAAYKQQFSSESWDERDLTVFAPSFRGIRVNLVRNAVLASSSAARRALDAAKLTDRVRTGWRSRLRQSQP